jgi:hypothetical protein
MGLSYVFSSLILGAIGALALAGCGGSSTNVAQDTEIQGAALGTAAEALGYIPSSKAGEHMGEEGTVRGSVKAYNYISGAKGRPYILIFDKPRIVKRRAAFGDLEVPESFKVVIWKDYHKNFPANFAGAYAGHTVCATGLIVDYNGDPAIEAHDPSQLKIDC